MVDEQIKALEERMQEMESKLDTSLQLMRKIEQGIFGDPSLNLPGVIKTQVALQDQVNQLKQDIVDLKKVNEAQDIAIKAKKGLTDTAVLWLQRIFWAGAVLLITSLIFSGELSVIDLIKSRLK